MAINRKNVNKAEISFLRKTSDETTVDKSRDLIDMSLVAWPGKGRTVIYF